MGGITLVILPTISSSSAQDTLSSASAHDCSSKSLYPLRYCRRVFTFIAQQLPVGCAIYIPLSVHTLGWSGVCFTRQPQQSTLRWGPYAGLPLTAGQQLNSYVGTAGAQQMPNHSAQGQGATYQSSDLQRRQPDLQKLQEPGSPLQLGKARRCPLAVVQQELRCLVPQKLASPKQHNLDSQVWLRPFILEPVEWKWALSNTVLTSLTLQNTCILPSLSHDTEAVHWKGRYRTGSCRWTGTSFVLAKSNLHTSGSWAALLAISYIIESTDP